MGNFCACRIQSGAARDEGCPARDAATALLLRTSTHHQKTLIYTNAYRASGPRHRCGQDQTRATTATMEAKTPDRDESKDAKEDSIVAKVGRYFFEDSSFSQTFEAWVSKNAPRIDPTLNDDEYPLEYTALYEEFKKLYEGLLEDYIEREGSSTEAFYAELREATERDEDSSEALMGQIMLATTDFDVFMLMMKESRRQYDVKEKSRHK